MLRQRVGEAAALLLLGGEAREQVVGAERGLRRDGRDAGLLDGVAGLTTTGAGIGAVVGVGVEVPDEAVVGRGGGLVGVDEGAGGEACRAVGGSGEARGAIAEGDRGAVSTRAPMVAVIARSSTRAIQPRRCGSAPRTAAR